VPDQGDSLLSLGSGFTPTSALDHLLWTGAPFAPGSVGGITVRAAQFTDLIERAVEATAENE
jgi:hypothetical protein